MDASVGKEQGGQSIGLTEKEVSYDVDDEKNNSWSGDNGNASGRFRLGGGR
jgi:hypothetical protein